MDDVGDIVKLQREAVNQLPPVCTVLKQQENTDSESDEVIVNLKSRLNEISVLEIWFESVEGKNKWRLQFDTRQSADNAEDIVSKRTEVSDDEILSKDALEKASQIITETFLNVGDALNSDFKPAKLMKNLEQVLERKRTEWSISTLRHMFQTVVKLADRRKINPELEIRWLNLTGFLLRPGFGAQLDEKRCEEVFRIFESGVQFKRNLQAASEFWILWRRIAAGLDKQQQMILYKTIAPVLLPRSDSARRKGKREKQTNLQEEIEMWRAIASLEKIPAIEKARLGKFLISKILESEQILRNKKNLKNQVAHLFWCVGRLGARVPFNAPVDTVVNKDSALSWIQKLLAVSGFVKASGCEKEQTFALAQLSRLTGDRTRDIDDELRSKVLNHIKSHANDENMVKMLTEIGSLKSEEQAQIFGESLPPALKLI